MHYELIMRVDKFSQIEHVERLNNVYLPKIKNHADKIDEFYEQMTQIKEVVQRFDEDLCLKASKGELDIMRREFQMNFISLEKWE